jgi:hypothetical protein
MPRARTRFFQCPRSNPCALRHERGEMPEAVDIHVPDLDPMKRGLDLIRKPLLIDVDRIVDLAVHDRELTSAPLRQRGGRPRAGHHRLGCR